MNVKMIKIIFNITIIIIILSCSNSKASNLNNANQKNAVEDLSINVIQYNFDTILKCNSYAYFDGYMRIPDQGCIYNPEFNSINSWGWADIVLIPREKFNIQSENYDAQDSLILSIDKMSSKVIKSKFNVLIFLINKKYLKFSPNQEINYYPVIPYYISLYQNQKQNWVKIDSIQITNEFDEIKWKDKIISSSL